jgi:uncharacterized MAPEG superfamily protein
VCDSECERRGRPAERPVLAKAKKGYDNRTPRDYLAKLEGWRARAHT